MFKFIGKTALISIILVMVVLCGNCAADVVDDVYTQSGGTATKTDETYTASSTDLSGVYVYNAGTLTLIDSTIITTGDTSSQDSSSFYGLNAAVLAASASSITMVGGSINTSGTGANGAFATGSGSTVTLTNVTIVATADGGHGVMATNGGTVVLTNVTITTDGKNSGAVATDRGSGTITVTGGTVVTNGADSPGIYSTGIITTIGGTYTATGSEAAVIEGANSITLTDTILSGAKKWGVLIYQSMSGDAEGSLGEFTMDGGSLTVAVGPAFYVTNTQANITLSGGAEIEVTSDILISAAAGNWGTSGSNGGDVIFIASDETISGDMITDDISSIDATLEGGTDYSGTIDEAALTIDATSTWNVTGDSILSTFSDPDGISGTSITNIIGNGFTVYYDSNLSANSYLGGLTYTLVDGGILTPSYSSGESTLAVYISSPGANDLLNSTSVTVIWTAVEGSSSIVMTEISTDNSTWTTVSGNSYALTLTADGAYSAYVRVTDDDGNIAYDEVAFTIDTVAPSLEILTPDEGEYNTTGNVLLTWNGSDDVSVYSISIGGDAWSDVDGTSYEFSDLSDGAHTIYVRAYDLAGNYNETNVTITVEATAPTADVSPTGNDVALDTFIVVMFSEEMDVSATTITVDGVNGTVVWDGNIATFVHSGLEYNSVYTVKVTGADLAGNSIIMSWTFNTTEVGSVEGYLFDEEGNVLYNTTVELSSSITAETDAYGHFIFQNMTVGNYTLTVDLDGYEALSVNFSVNAGQTTDLGDLEMTVSAAEEDEVDSSSESTDYAVFIAAGVVLTVCLVGIGYFYFLRRR